MGKEVESNPTKRGRKSAGTSDSSTPRKRLLIALIVAFFLVVFLAALALAYQVDTFLATDARFTLRTVTHDGELRADGPIQLIGLTHTRPSDVLHLFERDIGRSLYLLPLRQRRQELLAIDWVEDATLTRLWPDQLRISVRERTPVAVAALPGSGPGDRFQMMLVDRDGGLMRKPDHATFNLPIVFGLRQDQTVEFRTGRIELLTRLQDEVESLNARFSELDVRDPRNLQATLVLEGRTLTLMLGNEKYLTRVQNFLEHYETVLKTNPRANLFDMRLEDQIIATREGLSGV